MLTASDTKELTLKTNYFVFVSYFIAVPCSLDWFEAIYFFSFLLSFPILWFALFCFVLFCLILFYFGGGYRLCNDLVRSPFSDVAFLDLRRSRGWWVGVDSALPL